MELQQPLMKCGLAFVACFFLAPAAFADSTDCNITFAGPHNQIIENASKANVLPHQFVYLGLVRCFGPNGWSSGPGIFTVRIPSLVESSYQLESVFRTMSRCSSRAHLALGNPQKYDLKLVLYDADVERNPEKKTVVATVHDQTTAKCSVIAHN